MDKLLQPQVRAIKLSIEVLTKARREFSPGHVAYTRNNIRPVEINSDGITGVDGLWAKIDHEKYMEYSEAIRQMEDLIEIFEDDAVTVAPVQLAFE